MRYINGQGEQVGIVTLEEALRDAQDSALDLVEIASDADPPVCKALDFGKFRYAEQKRRQESRKKQRVLEVKEIKLRPGIEQHDYDVKRRAAERFIGNGDKVKFSVRFRGREIANQALGHDILKRLCADLGENIKVEQEARVEGRQLVMIISAR